MNTELTYSLMFTPSLSKQSLCNPVCSDKKIHIRFRDFNKPQVISGFEKKLTYLLAYLMNYSYISTLFDLKNSVKEKIFNEKALIDALLSSEDLNTIYQEIAVTKQLNFTGFKLTTNYNKKSETAAFGKLCQTAFPLDYDAFGDVKMCDLNTFLKKLNITLLEYLFNDAYAIVIHEIDNSDVNVKFTNKELRREAHIKTDFVTLW